MNLYLIKYDGEPYFVEAPSFTTAIDAWCEHVKVKWGVDYREDDQPHSVELMHDEAVIRYRCSLCRDQPADGDDGICYQCRDAAGVPW